MILSELLWDLTLIQNRHISLQDNPGRKFHPKIVFWTMVCIYVSMCEALL